jgi:hypothetical protein
MAPNFEHCHSERSLKSAKPHLIVRARIDREDDSGATVLLGPYISQVGLGWDEVIREEYNAYSLPLGRPVYSRYVKRGGENYVYATCLMPREAILKGWGSDGLRFCDPVTGLAPVMLETLLPRTADARGTVDRKH